MKSIKKRHPAHQGRGLGCGMASKKIRPATPKPGTTLAAKSTVHTQRLPIKGSRGSGSRVRDLGTTDTHRRIAGTTQGGLYRDNQHAGHSQGGLAGIRVQGVRVDTTMHSKLPCHKILLFMHNSTANPKPDDASGIRAWLQISPWLP